MYDLNVLVKRNKLAKIILFETIIIAVVSIILFCGKYPEYAGSKYDIFFIFNDKTIAYSFVMLMIIPIIGSLPYSDNYFAENNLRYNIISKVGKKKYFISKYLICFLSGQLNCMYVFELIYVFQLVAINIVGNVYCSNGALFFNFLFPDSYRVYFENVIITHPFELVQINILFASLFSGACGCLSYALSQLIPIKGLAYVNSFVVTFILSFILQYIDKIGFLLAYFNVFRLNTNIVDGFSTDTIVIIVCLSWIVLTIVLSSIVQLVVNYRNE